MKAHIENRKGYSIMSLEDGTCFRQYNLTGGNMNYPWAVDVELDPCSIVPFDKNHIPQIYNNKIKYIQCPGCGAPDQIQNCKYCGRLL